MPIHASHPHKLCLLKWFDAAFVYSEIAVNAKRLFMRYVFRNSSVPSRFGHLDYESRKKYFSISTDPIIRTLNEKLNAYFET